MNDRSWEELIDRIDSVYQIDNHQKTTQKLEDNTKLEAQVESIEFERDNKKFKIERITSPRIVDKKSFYSRSGGAKRLENIYDPMEVSHRVVFYQQLPDGYWNEIEPEQLLS